MQDRARALASIAALATSLVFGCTNDYDEFDYHDSPFTGGKGGSSASGGSAGINISGGSGGSGATGASAGSGGSAATGGSAGSGGSGATGGSAGSGGGSGCNPGENLCGGNCIANDDQQNCGGCNNDCGAQGLTCVGGFCSCTNNNQCNPGNCAISQLCDCGGTTCQPGETCERQGGNVRCTCNGGGSCTAGQICCATGDCTDTDTDTQNCGGCGRACSPGQTCNNGTCS